MSESAFKAVQLDDEQQIAYGIASLSTLSDGTLYEDLQGDVIEPAEIEKAFHEWAMESGYGDAMHDRKPHARMVECFVATPEKLALLLKAMGFDGQPPQTQGVAAWVGMKVLDPETWASVKDGTLRAFSIEGTCERVEKYNEDQPRDETGRFSEEGGSVVGNAQPGSEFPLVRTGGRDAGKPGRYVGRVHSVNPITGSRRIDVHVVRSGREPSYVETLHVDRGADFRPGHGYAVAKSAEFAEV